MSFILSILLTVSMHFGINESTTLNKDKVSEDCGSHPSLECSETTQSELTLFFMKKLIINSPKYGIKTVLTDNKDFKKIIRYKYSWRLQRDRDKNKFYVVTSNKEKRKIYLHRFILLFPKEQIDHRNGNGLDNRRKNLRVATNGGNQRNCAIPNTNTSGYKGVSFYKKRNTFNAYIHVKNKRINLGYFYSAKHAAKIYNEAAKKYFGEFARLNPIPR